MHKDTKEIENKNKKWLGWAAFLFVVFHFTTILISTFPESFTNFKIQRTANLYVKPLFSQTWSMFAPCPLMDNKLAFKLYDKGDSTKLVIPSEINFKYHSLLRFSHHGDLIIGEYNLLYWVKRELDDLNILPNHVLTPLELREFKKTNGSFYLKNYLKGVSHKLLGHKADSATFYLNYRDVENDVQNVYTLTNLR